MTTSKHKKLLLFLAHPALMHFTLPVIMLYLIAGTVAQKNIGLYAATKLFFSAPVYWLGFMPLPGLPILMSVIFINLLFKLLLKSPWRVEDCGVIITHIGVMLLLTGGLFTALFSHEGYLDVAENEGKSYISNFHERELVIISGDDETLVSFPHKELGAGDHLTSDTLPFSIEILEHCRNCRITAREEADQSYQGMAQHMRLTPAPPEREDERNMSGVTLAVERNGERSIYALLEDVPQWPEFTFDEKDYQIILRKTRRALPFRVELLDFERKMHPGTSLAKSYRSRVRIIDGSSQWESVISMNEPLRYKGYTLFQSSFIETPDGDISVLAVVWNAGRAFPYISGIAMCIGLLLHLVFRRARPSKGIQKEGAT